MRVLIVVSGYHAHIAETLMDGATRELEKGGATFDRVTVPGALEIPAAIGLAARGQRRHDGYVALGGIVRGPALALDIIAGQTVQGLMRLTVDHGLCIGTGIFAAETEDQALDLALECGGDAARACIDLVTLRDRLGNYS